MCQNNILRVNQQILRYSHDSSESETSFALMIAWNGDGFTSFSQRNVTSPSIITWVTTQKEKGREKGEGERGSFPLQIQSKADLLCTSRVSQEKMFAFWFFERK